MGNDINKYFHVEQKTWRNHRFSFDNHYRSEVLKLIPKKVKRVSLCYSKNDMFGLSYLHFYIMLDESYYIEFQGDISNNSLVVFRSDKFTETNILASTKDKGLITIMMVRVNTLLGMNNYSLLLRNCEHVSNYIYYGCWFSRQVEYNSANPFNWFLNKITKDDSVNINTRPEGLEEVKGVDDGLDKSVKNDNYTIIYKTMDKKGSYITDSMVVIILIGRSGTGKSNLINQFFGREIAESKASIDSVSRDIAFYYGKVRFSKLVKHICFVDTVGLFDSDMSQEDVRKFISGRISRNLNHYNTILFVNTPRYDKQLFEEVEKLLKESNLSKSNIKYVVTRSDTVDPIGLLNLKQQVMNKPDIIKFKKFDKDDVICVDFPLSDRLNFDGYDRDDPYIKLDNEFFEFVMDYKEAMSINGSSCTIL